MMKVQKIYMIRYFKNRNNGFGHNIKVFELVQGEIAKLMSILSYNCLIKQANANRNK